MHMKMEPLISKMRAPDAVRRSKRGKYSNAEIEKILFSRLEM